MSMAVVAQGNGKGNGHGNGNNKGENNERGKDKKDKDEDNNEDKHEVAYPTQHPQHGKNANHQPKKVATALLKDYPAANNVTWSKYKGDYTATFRNGIWRSTAVYHANGERRDTRTSVTRTQLPGTIWDKIFKRDNITPTQYIQIERPSVAEKIFRVLSANNTVYFYDQNGKVVSYDY